MDNCLLSEFLIQYTETVIAVGLFVGVLSILNLIKLRLKISGIFAKVGLFFLLLPYKFKKETTLNKLDFSQSGAFLTIP